MKKKINQGKTPSTSVSQAGVDGVNVRTSHKVSNNANCSADPYVIGKLKLPVLREAITTYSKIADEEARAKSDRAVKNRLNRRWPYWRGSAHWHFIDEQQGVKCAD